MTAKERKWWLRIITRDYFGVDINKNWYNMTWLELGQLYNAARLFRHKKRNPNMSLAQDFFTYLQRGIQEPF